MGRAIRWRKLEQVCCRAEALPDQYPVRFRLDGSWHEVERINRQWLEAGPSATDPVWRVFEVDSTLGRCLLRCQKDGWVWEIGTYS
ncbi:MAG: hypothetical protein D6806_03625 [Deltaproteobacteria bacterium]|nr:MAG: hypothetical protein D6806_03625 [Deltaproteobacteria bacterium]